MDALHKQRAPGLQLTVDDRAMDHMAHLLSSGKRPVRGPSKAAHTGGEIFGRLIIDQSPFSVCEALALRVRY